MRLHRRLFPTFSASESVRELSTTALSFNVNTSPSKAHPEDLEIISAALEVLRSQSH